MARQKPEHDSPARTRNHPGTSVPIADPSLYDVRVHHPAYQPSEIGAHAYSQGSRVHLGPGSEGHLPHEAWHVVQQKQGRVRPASGP